MGTKEILQKVIEILSSEDELTFKKLLAENADDLIKLNTIQEIFDGVAIKMAIDAIDDKVLSVKYGIDWYAKSKGLRILVINYCTEIITSL